MLKITDLQNWNYSEFEDATSLENYINQIKPMFLGKKLKKIMTMGIIYNPTYSHENHDKFHIEIDETKDSGLFIRLDEPIVFFIGDNRLEIGTPIFFSEINISINQLTLKEVSYQLLLDKQGYSYDKSRFKNVKSLWRDISFAYKKNIINQEVADIYINRVNDADKYIDCDYTFNEIDDDMFNEFCIKFKNGAEIVILNEGTYGLVAERIS